MQRADRNRGACIGPWLIHRQFLLPSINVRQPIEVSVAVYSPGSAASIVPHFRRCIQVSAHRNGVPCARLTPQRLRTAAQLRREGSGRALASFRLLRMV